MSVSTPPEGFRLSQQQEYLWRVRPGKPGSSLGAQCAFTWHGALEAATLEEALGILLARYEILRTWFYPMPDVAIPLQVIEEERAVPVTVHDLAVLEATAQEERLREMAHAAARPVAFVKKKKKVKAYFYGLICNLMTI